MGEEQIDRPSVAACLSFLADGRRKERHAFWDLSSELLGLMCPWILSVYTANPGKLCLIDQPQASGRFGLSC